MKKNEFIECLLSKVLLFDSLQLFEKMNITVRFHCNNTFYKLVFDKNKDNLLLYIVPPVSLSLSAEMQLGCINRLEHFLITQLFNSDSIYLLDSINLKKRR